MEITIIDTCVVYYLCGISRDSNFNIQKFQDENKHLGISFFTLFEILNKYNYKDENLKTSLKFLDENCKVFINKERGGILTNNIFKKCLQSKSKYEYYKKKLTSKAKTFFVDLMARISLIIGALYLGVRHKKEKYSERAFLTSKKCFEDLSYKVAKIFSVDFEKIFDSIYNKKLKSANLNKQKEFENIFIESIKLAMILCDGSGDLKPDSSSYESDFNALKQRIRSIDLSIEDINKEFSYFKTQKPYDKLFAKMITDDSNDIQFLILKNIIYKYINELKFDINDIVDSLNIWAVDELYTKHKEVCYLTCEKKWINSLKSNENKPNCSRLLNYIERYVSI